MSDYNAYGELYDQRPELVIHDRLKNSGMIRDVIDMAQQNNYKISFDRGPFRHDMLIKERGESSARPQSHTITSGLRYFRRLNEWRA
jgi:hypothetical protein